MNGIITVIKIFASIAVIAILGFLVFFLKDFQKDFAQPAEDRKERVGRLNDENAGSVFKRGEREFNRAVELIAMERLDDAREKLLFIQNLHADSEFGPEARRILGEINLDELLSVENMENKKVHTVVPGDNFIKIAQQYNTTLDCIMFLNGLLDTRGLHPGDEIIVMPLDFKLVIDLPRESVALFHRDSDKKEHVFVKEYPIIKYDLPKLGSRSLFSKVSTKVGEVNGESFQPIRSKYRNGIKVLGMKVARLHTQLRPLPKIDDVDPGSGVFLDYSAMEELAMLIRIGNEVEIKPTR
ncbi:LysM peptidoglycan-binding domain-containing protein [Akkermansiaceae bacterium]|nr:LysM peptidoglycan-binding domain-containing protein [Akkermansiaceae bacterium]